MSQPDEVVGRPVELAVTTYGDADPRRETVVVLHGLFGSGGTG